jgi:hypothetical protein
MAQKIYKTDTELQKAIDKYFKRIKNDEEKPTITGLAYDLGFESRQSFYDYEKAGAHSYTIKRARLRIESAYEQRLHGNSPTGAIFALKNFGWVDKQETDVTVKSGSEALREAIEALETDDADSA